MEEVIIDGACPPPPVVEAPTRARRQRRVTGSGDAAPVAARSRRTQADEERRERARHLASLYALGGAFIGAAPIPNPDMPILISVESRLVGDITRIYHPDGARSAQMRAMPIVGFAGYLLRGLSRRGHRRLPMLGWAVNGVIAYAGIRLIGEAVMRWCEATRRMEYEN